jgi:hypothetical protein
MQQEIHPTSIEPSIEPPRLSPLDSSMTSNTRSSAPASRSPSPQVHRWHLLVVVGLVLAADLLLYQGGGGLAGWASWCVIASVLVATGVKISKPLQFNSATIIIGLSLLFTAFRLLWQGSFGLAAISVMQLAIFAFLLHEVPLTIQGLIRFFAGWLPQGCRCLAPALLSSSGLGVGRWRWLEFGVPIMIAGLFAIIFVMANPDAVTKLGLWLQELGSIVLRWFVGLRFGQLFLWLLVVVLGLGALVPPWKEWLQHYALSLPVRQYPESAPHENRAVYQASRNTLVAVIVLFAAYLVAEFSTMWYREFPKGFHYSGYAHAGAAWLTAALALATIVVSAILRPEIQRTPGHSTLLMLARIWSMLNFVLAICVFNRLFIYIDYNGMTRMRVVAILGVCCVVAGFILVVIKASRGFSFNWLVERQVMTLAAFAYLLAVLPVDWLVYSYNCRKVLAGEESPAVQIAEHPLSSSALQAVLPLIDSNDPVISQGVAALVARQLERIDNCDSWYHFQISDRLLERAVNQRYTAGVQMFKGQSTQRDEAITRFRDQVWPWY